MEFKTCFLPVHRLLILLPLEHQIAPLQPSSTKYQSQTFNTSHWLPFLRCIRSVPCRQNHQTIHVPRLGPSHDGSQGGPLSIYSKVWTVENRLSAMHIQPISITWETSKTPPSMPTTFFFQGRSPSGHNFKLNIFLDITAASSRVSECVIPT